MFCDQYVSLLLLDFLTPALTSLRVLQQTTNWETTRKQLGIRRTSLGSLSEVARVFQAEHWRDIVQELATQALLRATGRDAEALRGLTAVDGSVFQACTRMAWALWQDDQHRAVKRHLHCDMLELAAKLVAQAYHYRWTIELFFRWLKCVLGARHFVAENQNGVALQMYAALIASFLIVLRTQRQPTRRTFEVLQFYLLGWVTEAELESHLASLKTATTNH